MGYETAKVQQCFTVLGVRLRPFCIGHRLILEACENSLLNPFAEPSRVDLAQAVLVCSRPFDEAQPAGVLYRLKLIRLATRKMDLLSEAEKFRAYVEQGSQFPVLKPGDGGRSPGGPFLLRLVQWIMSIGYSEQAAWNRPLGAAVWEWATYFEDKGSLKIQNQSEADFVRWCAEQDAKESK